MSWRAAGLTSESRRAASNARPALRRAPSRYRAPAAGPRSSGRCRALPPPLPVPKLPIDLRDVTDGHVSDSWPVGPVPGFWADCPNDQIWSISDFGSLTLGLRRHSRGSALPFLLADGGSTTSLANTSTETQTLLPKPFRTRDQQLPQLVLGQTRAERRLDGIGEDDDRGADAEPTAAAALALPGSWVGRRTNALTSGLAPRQEWRVTHLVSRVSLLVKATQALDTHPARPGSPGTGAGGGPSPDPHPGRVRERSGGRGAPGLHAGSVLAEAHRQVDPLGLADRLQGPSYHRSSVRWSDRCSLCLLDQHETSRSALIVGVRCVHRGEQLGRRDPNRWILVARDVQDRKRSVSVS